MSQLIEMYKGILDAVGLETKEDGSVFHGESRYFVKNKPLYLPLNSVLSRPDAADKLIFHPLAEAAAKGESDVVEDLRTRFALRLNVATAKLISFFLMLGAGGIKIKLDPEQMKVMSVVKQVDEKVMRDILDVLKATTRGDGKKTPLIKLRLSRIPHTVGKIKYTRTGIVSFPLYQAALEELNTKEKSFELLGVKINKKGLESFCRVMEFIFPGIDKDPEIYNQGSTSQIAPFTDALIRAVGGLISIFNERVDLYKDQKEVEQLRMPTAWIDIVDQMEELFPQIQAIPLQPNADGKARVSDVQTADLSVRPQAFVPETQQPTHAPQQVHVTPAPLMTQPTQYQQPARPQQQQQPEPEYIREDGKVRRNPNYLRPAMVGGLPGMGNPLDPYTSNVALPANTSMVPPVNMHTMQFGNAPQGSVYGGNYGVPPGRLPGLSY